MRILRKSEFGEVAAGVLGLLLLTFGLLLLLSHGCSATTPYRVEVVRVWGDGGGEFRLHGVDLDGDNAPDTLLLETGAEAVSIDDDFARCVGATLALGPFVWTGTVPEPISETRCFTEGGAVPFGRRAVTLLRAPDSIGGESSAEPSKPSPSD